MSADRMRADFEAWEVSQRTNATFSLLWFSQFSDGRYATPVIQGRYEIWQAAYSAGERRGLERAREICFDTPVLTGGHPGTALDIQQRLADAIERKIGK